MLTVRAFLTAAIAAAIFVAVNPMPLLSAAPRAATAAPQGGLPPELRSCTKRIDSNPCTACSELGVMDNECKSGHDFMECSGSFTTCNNGTQCDQHVGSNPCP